MTGSVAIVDYGVGNVASIVNMLKKAGFEGRLVATPEEIMRSDRILLPGVGAYDRAARILRDRGLKHAIVERAAAGYPILGVCLGMQLLMDGSEEGEGSESGLGLIPGRVVRFPQATLDAGLRIPHMGWNVVTRVGMPDALPSVRTGDRFYFVHSYYADPIDPAHRLGVSWHGIGFTSMVRSDNVLGAQFHPEKSHRAGMALLGDFARQ